MLNAGDTFVFRGDLVHFGAEYRVLNLRIRSYIDSPCAPEVRSGDTTYHVLANLWPIVHGEPIFGAPDMRHNLP